MKNNVQTQQFDYIGSGNRQEKMMSTLKAPSTFIIAILAVVVVCLATQFGQL